MKLNSTPQQNDIQTKLEQLKDRFRFVGASGGVIVGKFQELRFLRFESCYRTTDGRIIFSYAFALVLPLGEIECVHVMCQQFGGNPVVIQYLGVTLPSQRFNTLLRFI